MIPKLTTEQIEFYKSQITSMGEFREPEHRRLRIAVTKSLIHDAMQIEDEEKAQTAFSKIFLSDSGTLYTSAMAELLVEHKGEMFDKALGRVAKDIDQYRALTIGLALPKLSIDKMEKIVKVDIAHEPLGTVDGIIRGYLAWNRVRTYEQAFDGWANQYWEEITTSRVGKYGWSQYDVRSVVLNVYHENPLYAYDIIEIIKASAKAEPSPGKGFYATLLCEMSNIECLTPLTKEQYKENKKAFREASFDVCEVTNDVYRAENNLIWKMEAIPRLSIDKTIMLDSFKENILRCLLAKEDVLLSYGDGVGVFLSKAVTPDNFSKSLEIAKAIFEADVRDNWCFGNRLLLPLVQEALKYDLGGYQHKHDVGSILWYGGFVSWLDEELPVVKQLARTYGALIEPSTLLSFEEPIEANNYSSVDNFFTEMFEASFANQTIGDDKVVEVVELINKVISVEGDSFERNDNLKAAYARYDEIMDEIADVYKKTKDLYKVFGF